MRPCTLRAPDRSDRGATMVEFAIVIPILLMVILALFDFVRYLTIRGIMNSAAHRAVSLASVVENLDTDCNALPDDLQAACGPARAAAIQRVLMVARDLPLDTLV
ncbi:MAG: pilus assembly protein, partial [Bdellovibrionales bacterium]|nr:pilus assembly protein [Bdellovibrionales bacterium]